MGRKHVTDMKKVLEASGQATDIVGEISTVEQLDMVSYDFSWANGSSLNATLFVQYRNGDDDPWKNLPIVPDIALSGASGALRLDIDSGNFKATRPTVEFTAGSCDLLATVKCTTRGA